MVTSLLNWREVIIRRMQDGNGKRTLEPGPISPFLVTNGIQTLKTKPTKSPQKDSHIPHMPCKQTLRQPTPGLSGTKWSEDLFCDPSQNNEPPIPGPSLSSKPPEDVPTHEPEPEVALTQSTEEPFGKFQIHFFNSSKFALTLSQSSPSIFVIDNTPIGSPTPPPSPCVPPPSLQVPPGTPVQSSSHSHNKACQEFSNLQSTFIIP
ncbi:hypothetical protein O181_118329 [Austropuccinia psidii MF-1]|uniref:Uncharacterized protein n=1 Tax=Austropuccinia psidii MF-1 TaxID=1389203 RepID=A0A9Q3PYD6_9BASI|nr:hypothetical protein [Austropuccinia psidii MF-1]